MRSLLSLPLILLFIGCSDELDSKLEYDVLSRMDFSNYHNVEKVTPFTKDGYNFAAIPCESETVFVLLNPKYKPYYKQVGQCNYELTWSDIQTILRQFPYPDTNSTVIECLNSHLEGVPTPVD